MSILDPSPDDWDSCSSTEAYKFGENIEKRLLFYGAWRPTSCVCPKQCYENIYTVYTEATQTGSSSARLRIFFQVIVYEHACSEKLDN